MKKPTAEQMKYSFKEGFTNWGSYDDRHILHLKLQWTYDETYFTDEQLKEFGETACLWCERQWGKPFSRSKNIIGTWKCSEDYKMFIFKQKSQAMLFKVTFCA